MVNNKRRPIKVLNVLWKLDVGGMEASLVALLTHLDPGQFQMDFLVTSQYEGDYDAVVKKMGARIVLGKDRFSPGHNLRDLAAVNRRFGPYDVLHSHRHYSGAPLLRAAHQLGVPLRIAHSHTIPTMEGSTFDRARVAIARRLVRRHCTHGLAVSRAAAASLFGERWESDQRFRVLPRGCDFEAFRATDSRERVRRELGIGADEMALVHVASFNDNGNHEFIVEVGWELSRLAPQFRIVLIGDGPLLHHIQSQVAFAGLSDRVMFLGEQPDLHALLLAMDALIFPSNVETLGIAVVEAQAAGLVCFLSDRVVPEVDAVPELLHRIPMEAGPGTWAREIVAHGRAPITQAEALERCMAGKLGIESYVECHKRLYTSTLDPQQVREI